MLFKKLITCANEANRIKNGLGLYWFPRFGVLGDNAQYVTYQRSYSHTYERRKAQTTPGCEETNGRACAGTRTV